MPDTSETSGSPYSDVDLTTLVTYMQAQLTEPLLSTPSINSTIATIDIRDILEPSIPSSSYSTLPLQPKTTGIPFGCEMYLPQLENIFHYADVLQPQLEASSMLDHSEHKELQRSVVNPGHIQASGISITEFPSVTFGLEMYPSQFDSPSLDTDVLQPQLEVASLSDHPEQEDLQQLDINSGHLQTGEILTSGFAPVTFGCEMYPSQFDSPSLDTDVLQPQLEVASLWDHPEQEELQQPVINPGLLQARGFLTTDFTAVTFGCEMYPPQLDSPFLDADVLQPQLGASSLPDHPEQEELQQSVVDPDHLQTNGNLTTGFSPATSDCENKIPINDANSNNILPAIDQLLYHQQPEESSKNRLALQPQPKVASNGWSCPPVQDTPEHPVTNPGNQQFASGETILGNSTTSDTILGQFDQQEFDHQNNAEQQQEAAVQVNQPDSQDSTTSDNTCTPTLRRRPRTICSCPGCGKLVRKMDMGEHLRWHAGEPIFKCSWVSCEKSFVTAAALRIHKKTHTDVPRTYICQRCGKGFAVNSRLRRHVRENCKETCVNAEFAGVNDEDIN